MTKAPREELARHLQRFLLVLLPDGNKWFFRYYDPRILQVYLPTCQPVELEEFFGPVRGFAVLDAEHQKTAVFEHAPESRKEATKPTPQPGGLWPIRPEQFHALSNAAQDDFVRQVADHMREFFPQECSRMNHHDLYKTIHHGIRRAASYGISAERHVCQYIDLMFAFGQNFDQDPRHGWAREVLNDRSIATSDEKLQRLFRAARAQQAREGTVHAR